MKPESEHQERDNDATGPARPWVQRPPTDIVGAFLAKYGQITDRSRTDMASVNPYKAPEIRKNGNDWYIEYQYRIPSELREYGKVYERFRVRKDLNKIRKKKGVAAAEIYAEELLKIVRVMLKEGFNPFMSQVIEATEKKFEAKQKEEKARDVNLNAALNIFIEQKKGLNVSDRTITDYQSYIGMFREYMASTGMLKASILDIETAHIEEYLKDTARLRNWEPTTYNCHRDFLSSVFNELIRWSKKDKRRLRIIDNPVHGVDSQIAKPSNHKYYTADHARRIKEFMQERYPLAFDICQFIYYSCTRPKVETRLIKIEHIDLERRVLRIPRGKTGYRYVPICDELAQWLEQKNIGEYPGEYYLFGKNGEISAHVAGVNYLTNRYKEVKDAFGISAEYTLYGWKHTRCVDLILSGLSTVEAMQITGHDDVDSFEKYIRDMGVAMSSKVIGKTVKF